MGALALAGVLVVAANAAATFAWPLDLPRELTSSFGEYRAGRFHAGIDLRTGDIGKAVHAAGDGYVSRVRCSPFGYGKAVYLTLDTGYTVVYGHLSDYRDDLRAFVRAAQHKAENYTIDLSPTTGQFRVKSGEIIAKSGDTGIGVPHLHWEIRDAKGALVNPRLLGVTWPDTTRPTLKAVAVFPVDGAVNGDPAPQVVPLKSLGDGRYTAPTLSIDGRVTFAIDCIDPEKGGAKLGIREARVRAGGQEVFTLRQDALDYDTMDSGAVAYAASHATQGRFLTLWRAPGNVAPGYALSPGDGVVPAAREALPVEIAVADFAGNTSTIALTLAPAREPQPASAKPASGKLGASKGTVSLEAWGDYATLTVHFDAPEGVAPKGAVDEAALDFVQVDPATFRAPLRALSPGTHTLALSHPRIDDYRAPLTIVRAGAPATTLGDAAFRATPAKDAAFGTLFLQATPAVAPPAPGLKPLARAWELGPKGQPLHSNIDVSFPIPTDAQAASRQVAIYRSSGSGWSRLKTESREGRLHAATGGLGIFAVFADDTAPALEVIAAASAGKRPELAMQVRDGGSGIESVEIRCGKRWLLSAYDPEKALVRWEQDEDLPPGKQEITFRATDTAGNTTERTRTVDIAVGKKP